MHAQEQQNAHVQSQPSSSASVSPWVQPTAPHPSSSQGLEYLSQVSYLSIKIELGWCSVCRDTTSEVKNDMGQQVYNIKEDGDCFCDYFLESNRPFTIMFIDHTGSVVLEMCRPFSCPQCPEKVEVRTPSGVPMAYIAETKFPPKIKIQNENGEDVLKIVHPFCSNIIKMMSIAGNYEIGRATIHTSGVILWPSAKIYNIHFPLDLDVKMKAAILCACLFCNFLTLLSFHARGPSVDVVSVALQKGPHQPAHLAVIASFEDTNVEI